MGNLVNFLNEKGQEWRTTLAATQTLREDWVRSVNGLVDQMDSWLRDADKNQILQIDVDLIEKREEKIGYYRVRAMTLRLGLDEVRVVPIARFVVSAPGNALLTQPQGRVDITNGEKSYLLYHMQDTPDGRWVIIDPSGRLAGFDREVFESAIQDLLK